MTPRYILIRCEGGGVTPVRDHDGVAVELLADGDLGAVNAAVVREYAGLPPCPEETRWPADPRLSDLGGEG